MVDGKKRKFVMRGRGGKMLRGKRGGGFNGSRQSSPAAPSKPQALEKASGSSKLDEMRAKLLAKMKKPEESPAPSPSKAGQPPEHTAEKSSPPTPSVKIKRTSPPASTPSTPPATPPAAKTPTTPTTPTIPETFPPMPTDTKGLLKRADEAIARHYSEFGVLLKDISVDYSSISFPQLIETMQSIISRELES